jgi:hypothetical protein
MAATSLQTICWKMPNEIHSYTELQQQIHDELRVQHPEWIEPNGDCPTCDSYESRLAELLGLTQRSNAVKIGKPAPEMSHAASLLKYRARAET